MRRLFLLALLALPLFGTSTTVTDTIKLADGTTPNGKLYIEFPFSCFDSDGSPIANTYKPVTVSSGVFTVTLVSNEDCVGTYYNVTYDLRYGNENETHKWVVPDSGPVDIEDVQSDGTASTTNAAVADRVQINGSDVTNANFVSSSSVTVSVDTSESPDEVTFTAGGGVPTVYNVSDYGADGDGDDTSAIQAAIDAAEAAGGGTVWLPVGTYSISSSLTIEADNVHLRGSGYGGTMQNGGNPQLLPFASTILHWDGAAAGTMLSINPPTNGNRHSVWVRGIAFDAGDADYAATGISIKALSGGGIRDVIILDCNPGTSTGCLYLTSGDDGATTTVNLRNNTFRNIDIVQLYNATSAGPGIYMDRGTNTASDVSQNVFQDLLISYYGNAGVYAHASDNNQWLHMIPNKLGGSGVAWLTPSTAVKCGWQQFYAVDLEYDYQNDCDTGTVEPDMMFGWNSDSAPGDSITTSNDGAIVVYGPQSIKMYGNSTFVVDGNSYSVAGASGASETCAAGIASATVVNGIITAVVCN